VNGNHNTKKAAKKFISRHRQNTLAICICAIFPALAKCILCEANAQPQLRLAILTITFKLATLIANQKAGGMF